jgi:hypothetical protein
MDDTSRCLMDARWCLMDDRCLMDARWCLMDDRWCVVASHSQRVPLPADTSPPPAAPQLLPCHTQQLYLRRRGGVPAAPVEQRPLRLPGGLPAAVGPPAPHSGNDHHLVSLRGHAQHPPSGRGGANGRGHRGAAPPERSACAQECWAFTNPSTNPKDNPQSVGMAPLFCTSR